MGKQNAQVDGAKSFLAGLLAHRRPSFAIIVVAMALQSIAANVVHPVEPAFYIMLGLPSWIFGVAFAAMSLGLFALAPFWGMVSDRVGRIPTLVVTMVLYGFCQLAFCVSTTVGAIVVARFAAGATCSGVGVAAMAYVADISGPKLVGRRMSIYAAVQTCATAMGFLVGGFVGVDDPRRSFILQFFILVFAALVCLFLLAESPSFERSAARLTLKSANPLAAMAGTRELMSPWMAAFLASVFCALVASSAYDNSFNYYLRDVFAFPTTYNGLIYAAMGLLGLGANLTVGLRLQRSRDGELSLGVVLACAAVLLGLSMLAGNMAAYLALNVAFYVFNTMYAPLMQGMAIQGERGSNGQVSGLFQSVRSLGMVAGSLVAGFIYDANPLAPFAMGVAAFALAAVAMLLARRHR